jgi:cytidylate kinase
VSWQRSLREREPLVGEGRDLGTVVFPDAEVKLFLDADLTTRAARRHAELTSRGASLSLEAVRDDLRSRDERDRSRADSPLRQAADAVVVDTSGMDVDRQVEAALRVIRAHPDCPRTPDRPISGEAGDAPGTPSDPRR